jgi:hypothetical protein
MKPLKDSLPAAANAYYGTLMDPVRPFGLARDALLELQLSVARRADELARTQKPGTSMNLHCWLLAEAEILGAEIARRPNGATPGMEPGAEMTN